jgi:hypothetical protein
MELDLTPALSPLVVVICRAVVEVRDVSEAIDGRVVSLYCLVGLDDVLQLGNVALTVLDSRRHRICEL